MTSSEIRQSFLDFFEEKKHTTVPSASLLPQSPGLLFTNAGMNQFVDYFLGTENPPYDPARATDTQKCIRAGGKHNDLDDVGYDSYHHTFFEMLGNWSFGDYFKEEAIEWAWELIVEKWGFPAERLYATVYSPDEAAGDPSSFDQDSYDFWETLFKAKDLDPKKHIVKGGKKDNFWMMGNTGPCGPSSELHVDITPNGDTGGKLVNKDSDECIEIWNLVFVQYNANEDGTFTELPSKHVDTGMGFERACNIIQNTKQFTDFSNKPSNYTTDVFTPIIKKLEELSGKEYKDVYPKSVDVDKSKLDSDMKVAIAFRVVADHIRTLAFSIADGINPGNTGRNYVIRRILRRAVNYGRTLGFLGEQPFLPDLIDTIVEEFGEVFPELKTRVEKIKKTLKSEEETFNRTLAKGLVKFKKELESNKDKKLSGDFAFQLYDTFGFPLDLTEILCQQNGIKLDTKKFDALMLKQKELGKKGQKDQVIKALKFKSDIVTKFVGFFSNSTKANVKEIHEQDDIKALILDRTPFFAEMGGQDGDTGWLVIDDKKIPITKVSKIGDAVAHIIAKDVEVKVDDVIGLLIDRSRRTKIEKHHTATHLLNWALKEIVSEDTVQQGSSVTTDRLRFDFTGEALTKEQVIEVENKVNEAIYQGDAVSWLEKPYDEVKDNKDITQFFGDKYGERVRIIQIGGKMEQLDGYSMELCGGTHVCTTGELEIFKIKSEGAISAGVRRIEAVVGSAADSYIAERSEELDLEIEESLKKVKELNAQLKELEVDTIEIPTTESADLADKDIYLSELKEAAASADKSVKKKLTAKMASQADEMLIAALESGDNIVEKFDGDGELVTELMNSCKKKKFPGAAFFIVDDGKKLNLGAYVGADGISEGFQAGKLIQEFSKLAGGKGGGKNDTARGAAPQRDKAAEILKQAKKKLA